MEKEFINGRREIFMSEIGSKEKCKDKGNFIGNKATLTMGNTKMTLSMEKDK